MPRQKTAITAGGALKTLRAFGLAYPGAHTKSPWPGHLDLAVKDRTFAYLSIEGEPFSTSCKLPHSVASALLLPFTTPTAYGLGKSGWVTARFDEGETPPVALFKEWIDESYRAQAPKKLVASLGAPLLGGAEDARAARPAKAAKAAKPAKAARPAKPAKAAKPARAAKAAKAAKGRAARAR